MKALQLQHADKKIMATAREGQKEWYIKALPVENTIKIMDSIKLAKSGKQPK